MLLIVAAAIKVVALEVELWCCIALTWLVASTRVWRVMFEMLQSGCIATGCATGAEGNGYCSIRRFQVVS